ncbi:Coiled-coil domain containing protein 39 [Dissostichus eleginoides]|uniref:Coiled-coil domain containing protein 39 n=1 Tax=Dissostichus eleginoides TaxID=100907 RepID=A0AAD9FJF7_DISEL|nr:Coiled-coil domain containing protein 39 [Dissostichus eleginoides]
MADTAPRSSVAPAFSRTLSRSRVKPEIYMTVDGKVIVDDELLNFLPVKIKTLSQDEIVLLAANTFDSEWIESSKKVLFELCPTTQRNVSHKGERKDVNNIKSCLKVMNECGENTPRFVSYYLDELPPGTFTNMDVSSLLGRMEQLCAEVCSMKHAMQLQADVSEDFRAITVEIDRLVCALEHSTDLTRGLDGSDAAAVVGACLDGTALGAAQAGASNLGFGVRAAAGGFGVRAAAGASALNVERATTMDSPSGLTFLPGSPKWSHVVKKRPTSCLREGC